MFKEKMIQQLLHSAGLIKLPPLVKTLVVLFSLVLTLPTAVGQQDDFERSLATFDQRADEVRVIVDSSRNPQANTVFESAIRTRGQAETTYRQGNLQAAKSLLDRAFALLVQAENLARSGGGGEPELQRLRNLLKSLRQSLQDSQRWLHELEINNRPGDTPSTVSSFLVEQSDRTEALLDRAEEECSNTESERCRDLLDRARLLFDQADQLLPVALEPSTGAAPGVENRLRDARQFLDRAQSELDQIQKELVDGEGNESGTVSRIRNVENLIRYGNDRLQEADIQTENLQQGQATTLLTLLRRSNELAHLAVRSVEGGSLLQTEFDQRNERVDALREQVENLQGVDGTSLPQYTHGIELQNGALEQAESGNLDLALQILSQAATAFNNALAQVGTAVGGVNSGDIYSDLKGKFEQDFNDLISNSPNDGSVRTPCSEMIERARNQAEQSEIDYQAGNVQIALSLLNQAQQSLNEAKTCLGISTIRIVEVLNRLQTQFDKRLPPFEENSDSRDEASQVYLKEAKNLRELSDSQESQGNIEQAIQTVGRAISQLGALQRSTSDASVLSDLQLLDSLQNRYDERASRVRELAESRGDSGPIDLLDQADQLRKESESASQSGNYRMGITLMGQSISLLERAASGS